MRLLPIILAERHVLPLFLSKGSAEQLSAQAADALTADGLSFLPKNLICRLQIFPLSADIFHYPLESFCYKVSNACYKLCNMYYKLCNIYSKPLNKKYHIWREKLSAQTGKNSSGLVKNILLEIFAVMYERRCCKEEK